MKKMYLLILIYVFTCTTVKAQLTNIHDFNGSIGGSNPVGSLISDGTFLYGMSYLGGPGNYGVIFKVLPDGTQYSVLMSFAGTTTGAYPYGDLYYDGTYLYGMTNNGGIYQKGTIFKILTNGTGYMKLLDFDETTTGGYPYGSLISDGTFLYGMTYQGGANGDGVIFKIMPDGTGFVKLFDFAGINGSNPMGSLFYDGTYLYGMTNQGGTSTIDGVIFKIHTNGTGFVKLLDFNGTNGSLPLGNLISDGTFLYGMTSFGGTNNQGAVFKILPDGNGYVNLHDFVYAIGAAPEGSLISDGTFLYGTVSDGGINLHGGLFKISPIGTGYLNIYSLVATDGLNPHGSLLIMGNQLFGTAQSYGQFGYGTIFKYHDAGLSVAENSPENDFSVFPNPSLGIFRLNSDKIESRIYVSNVLGEIVFQSIIMTANATIDLSDQPNGIYFVNVKSDKATFTQKIIISK